MLPDGMLIGCRQGNLFEVLRTLDGPLTACNVVNKGCKASLCNITLHLKNFTHKSGLDWHLLIAPPRLGDFFLFGGLSPLLSGSCSPTEREFLRFRGTHLTRHLL